MVLTIVGIGLVAGACTSSGGGSELIGPAGTTTSTAATTSTSSTTTPLPTTSSVDATKAAILAAYRAAWADIHAVEGHYPIDVFDSRLPDHMAGKELSQVQSFAHIMKFQNEYLAGPALDTSRAIVKQLVGSVAVVSDCEYDGSVLMNGKTNQIVNPAGTERELANAKVEFVDGTWKISEFNQVSPGCTVAN